jgi:hypothetical protein
MTTVFEPPYQFRTRWLELHRDGYLEFLSPGNWRLTPRGLAVLMACAKPPQIKTQLTKPSLLSERMRTDAERSRQTLTTRTHERGPKDE